MTKDSNGNILADGDSVTLIKDLKVKGSGGVTLKRGTLVKNIRLTGDLARKWTISSDEKTITFYLRSGVKWQMPVMKESGTAKNSTDKKEKKPPRPVEFTSKDVEFTYWFPCSACK